MFLKKIFIFLLVIIFFSSEILPSYAGFSYSLASDYLCEIGIKFYKEGRFIDALHELRKALIVSPRNEIAQKYILLIQEELKPVPPVEVIPPAVEVAPPVKEIPIEKPPAVKVAPPVKTRLEAMEELLEKLPPAPPKVEVAPAVKVAPHVEKVVPIEKVPPAVVTPLPPAKTRAEIIQELLEKAEKEKEKMPPAIELPPAVEAAPPVKPPLPKKEVSLKEVPLVETLTLDESLKALRFPIEIEKGKSIIIKGKNIRRFLVTRPDVLDSQRLNPDEILVTGKDIGYTYLHVWDDNDRWTLEFLTVPVKPEGPTYEELMRKEQERAANFKLRYSVSWSSFESGRRLSSLERSFYSYNHLLSLSGPVPYGDLDSYLSVRSLKEATDLTYFSLGLEKGRLYSFKDFSLRAFDYSAGVTNLAFSNPFLRGVLFKSPAFDKKIDYTLFWGREGGGRFGNLSPGIAKIKNSFISGFSGNFSPKVNQNYNFSIFSGWGRDRPNDLNSYGYDLNVDYGFKQWGLGYELAYDSETFAYLINADFNFPNLKLTNELRNTDKKFKTMTGWGWRAGEVGLLSTLTFKPLEELILNSRLNVFQDRLFPNPENTKRLNEDFDWNLTYTIDPLTTLRLDYTLQNELGRVSALRSQNAGIGLYRSIEFVRKINTFLIYRHQESKHFVSPASDFIRDKINLGLRFSIFGDLYYYLNKEFNWVEERGLANHSQPSALETGVNWNSQFFKSPFYGNFRLTYRDEEDTLAPLSFLSGEDYLEGYAEFSYRPKPEMEAFCSTRVRNIWADNPNVSKRIDANFNAGMRYLWDTGVRWQSKGDIEGYVFKDLNSDGLRQRDEAPVEGIKLWLGKDKFQLTDEFGYYKFKGIRAAKAYVTMDTSALPTGFVLTVPATQQTDIAHNRAVRLDFGISSRSEITGFIFEDVDGNGTYGKDDKGIKGAVITLEDGKKAITDGTGRYNFTRLSTGEHTITLDLNSLPVFYIPQVPLTKKISLFEGVSYVYNIPLKKIKK